MDIFRLATPLTTLMLHSHTYSLPYLILPHHQTVKEYFSDVENLNEALFKSIRMCLHRILETVRHHPADIVTAIRLVERQEMSVTLIYNVLIGRKFQEL